MRQPATRQTQEWMLSRTPAQVCMSVRWKRRVVWEYHIRDWNKPCAIWIKSSSKEASCGGYFWAV